MVPELKLLFLAKKIGDVAVDGRGMEKSWIFSRVAKGNFYWRHFVILLLHEDQVFTDMITINWEAIILLVLLF